MKKYMVLFLSVVTAVSLAACGSGQSSSSVSVKTEVSEKNAEQVSDTAMKDETDLTDKNILIVYFTVPETDGADTVASASRVATDEAVMGNTEYMANAIQSAVGGELFVIETEQKYPGTHNELLDFAYGELMRDERPALASKIENFDDYDVFLSVIQTGTQICLCLCILFLRNMISAVKPSFPL